MSYNLTEKRQKLKLQLEGRLAEEEIKKRSIHVTKLHIPTIFKSVPDLTNFLDEENGVNKCALPNYRLNKSAKNVNKGTDCEEAQLRNNYHQTGNTHVCPTSNIFNFTNPPRENTYYEIDTPGQDKIVTLRKAELGAVQDLNVYDIPPPPVPSKDNTNVKTNASTSTSNNASKTTLFKKNKVLHKLSIKDDLDNPLSPKSPMFETLQKIPVLKRSGSRVGFYAKEEIEKQNTSARNCQINPISGDYLYMAAQVGTNLKEIYSNITLDKEQTDCVTATENDEINKQLLEEDHYENIEIIRKNYLLSKKSPMVVQIDKKPVPALRQKTSI